MEKYGEEFILKKHVYKPYHPWRHGHRREKIHAYMINVLRILLIAESLILAMRYLEEHTMTQMIEREVSYEIEAEHAYGIGFEMEKREWFWFHKRTEIKTK
ncbi:MAG: hypothetical protein IKU20_07160 [Lachnospiraceae bacterium]|nr:hypothetical protein [Lachnospiraceae bacterium]